MKIVTKIKNTLLLAGITIMALPKKVLGTVPVYGVENVEKIVENQTDYGVEILDNKSTIILTMLKLILIPLLLIIGIIIYWKKSKKPTKTKIIKILIALLIVMGLIGLILLCQYLFF